MWALYAILSILASAVTMVFSPVIVLFSNSNGELPCLLRWCGQEDNTLDGDDGWKDKSSHPFVNSLPTYLRRVLWLCRNPAQVFDSYVSADLMEVENMTILGNNLVSDQPKFVPGYCFSIVSKYWMLYVCFPTFPGMCCRMYLGWKLMDYIHGKRPDNARLTVSINPFMTRGKYL